ncbi:hypothetical protein SAMN04489812_1667 [Microlunatus soli]|uniref:Uncharacterized protein n=1 Tax=Microlunatus soli TaxID=630515 RepID=A0A1H1RJC5_9ACTN|nr:hypothetical protein SAMN04489812_1667 [Microlunatus soli]
MITVMIGTTRTARMMIITGIAAAGWPRSGVQWSRTGRPPGPGLGVPARRRFNLKDDGKSGSGMTQQDRHQCEIGVLDNGDCRDEGSGCERCSDRVLQGVSAPRRLHTW